MFQLTRDNYYTVEADREFLSCSQYEEFLDCEARAMAKLDGRFVREETEAFLVGNYFHSYFEGPEAHEAFCKRHFDDIYKTKEVTVKRATKTTPAVKETVITGKYAPFEKADKMIATAENDPQIKNLIDEPGENEIVMYGKLFGKYPWKIRLDKYIESPRMIIDWKTVANIQERMWNPEHGEKVSFVRNFNYVMRAAVYCEIEKQWTGKKTDPLFWLVCISKQDPPDKEIIPVELRQEMDLELEKIHDKITRIQNIKDGLIKPKRCGHCEYCRKTKKLTMPLDFWKLDPDYVREREDDYARDEWLMQQEAGCNGSDQ